MLSVRDGLAQGKGMADAGGPIIVFDPECVLCSANAQLVLKHDCRRVFRLTSIQGEVGQALCRRFGIDPDDPETMLLIEGDMALRDSDAVLAIYERLGGRLGAVRLLKWVPRRLRDRMYRWVARNRYRLFGKRDTCWVPDQQDADRIL